MTTTPESWDDVGTLRLEVNSISQKVLDVQEGLNTFHGLNDVQLKMLREEMAQIAGREQRKERLKTSALLGCFLVLQVFILCVNTGSSSGFVQRLYTAAWKTHGDDLEASKTANPLPVAHASKHTQKYSIIESGRRLKHRTVSDATQEVDFAAKGQNQDEEPSDERTRTTKISHGHGEEAQEAERDKNDFGEESEHEQTKMHQRSEHEVKDRTPALDAPTAQHTQSLTDAEGHRVSGEDSFQQFSHGWFWVCFPPNDFERNLQKYTPVFEEFALSQKWKVNAYCWLKATKLLHEERLCDDPEKITFGVEMERKSTVLADTSDALSSNSEMPKHSSFDDCVDFLRRPESKALFEMQSPARFHQTFPPDQDIQASLVKEFLNDAHSGKIRQIPHGKGDL